MTMRAVLVSLGLVLGAHAAALQLSTAHKTGGAMPNTCGNWKYGTIGMAGEATNPFCKSTERDAGTTGLVHALGLPAQANAFTQTVQFAESDSKCTGTGCEGTPSAYTMTTKYWNDRPCHSGEMFRRCTALDAGSVASIAGCASMSGITSPFSMNYTNGLRIDDTSGVFKQYTSQFPGAPACLLTCCESACPKTACAEDTHAQCPPASTFSCPMWPQCIVNGNCDSKTPTCTGLAGEIKGDSCAFGYPGCGAVNDYPNLKYNGVDAQNTMTVTAAGGALDISHTVTPTQKMDKLCGASNNMFSYKASGSAALLSSAAVFPDKTSRRRNTDNADPETDPAKWECNAGHPLWCECSSVASVTLTSLKLTIKDASILSTFNSECSASCIGVAQAQLNKEYDLTGSTCDSTSCAFLKRIGYEHVVGGKYYFQYYRPGEEENMLYLGAQTTTLAAALDTNVHAEGVYSLNTLCSGCSWNSPSFLMCLVAMIVGVFMPRF